MKQRAQPWESALEDVGPVVCPTLKSPKPWESAKRRLSITVGVAVHSRRSKPVRMHGEWRSPWPDWSATPTLKPARGRRWSENAPVNHRNWVGPTDHKSMKRCSTEVGGMGRSDPRRTSSHSALLSPRIAQATRESWRPLDVWEGAVLNAQRFSLDKMHCRGKLVSLKSR